MRQEELRTELRSILGEGARVNGGGSNLRMYGQDQGDIPPLLEKLLFTATPQLVVAPRDEEEVLKVIDWAREKRVPVIPRGSASYAFGGVVPVEGGIILDLGGWQEILTIDEEAQTVTVQSGVRWTQLDRALEARGLALRSYPTGKYSTVGGWVATGGLGIGSLKNGHLREQIVSLRVLTPRGEAKVLEAGDPELEYYVGTEGQMGLISQITLKVREAPRRATPVLVYCPDGNAAMAFAHRVTDAGLRPFHVKYLDENRIRQANALLGERLIEESDGLLMDFDTEEEADEALELALSEPEIRPAPQYLASYLWQERLFSMKVRRLGRGLLATEVLVPWDEAPGYCRRARALGNRVGVQVACEVHLVGGDEALVIPMFLSAHGGAAGFMHLMLVMMLTQESFRHGGRPYGVGIWFTPFVRRHHEPEVVERYLKYKRRVDPAGILNPGKYFSIRSKWWGVPGLMFRPRVLELGLRLLIWTSPAWGPVARALGGSTGPEKTSVVRSAALACTRCGSCAAVCPAAVVMKDEGLSPRAKLWTVREGGNNGSWNLSPEEARTLFMCLRCKACERVCQSQLPLCEAWDDLEESLARQFGRPEEAVREFVEAAEASDEYWERVKELS